MVGNVVGAGLVLGSSEFAVEYTSVCLAVDWYELWIDVSVDYGAGWYWAVDWEAFGGTVYVIVAAYDYAGVADWD